LSPSASDSTPAIVTTGLGKRFGERRALDGIDLEVRRGSVYGLLGPNGAGKTTMVRLLVTLLTPSAGRALVLGHDVVREPQAVRRKISLTGQFASVDEDLTGHENLVLLSRLLGLARRPAALRAEELLAAFELSDVSSAQVKTYSGGMRRRLDIAASLIRTPELLFLDEPTTGLDPRSRGQVWEIVRSLVSHGTTVLLTTQYLEEADQLAERIAVIDRGKVIAEGTSSELKASIGRGVLHVRLARASARAAALELLSRRLGSVQSDADPRALSAAAPEAPVAAAALSELIAAGIEVAEFSLGQPSLDEVFFALTGHAPGTEAAGDSRAESGS
jgi:ABC-2 type transport system ATP-binding protein